MGKTIAGKLSAEGVRVAIVVARFNELVTRRLLEGALDTLRRHGADEEAIDIAWTPGSFEIPVVAKRFAEAGRHDVVIALGALLRGATPRQ